ncbi:MAG TPA: hypothetical protein VHK90_04865, partial [Thermoanaerobaculia bacterium]|nr:hypothetical protein [Thermoanaerobaculia bacterium]
NLWCRRFMTMYLLADHARANLLGHCEPRHTGYDYMPESISAACDVPAEIVLEPTDGAAFIPRPNGEYALIVTFDDLPHDAVALVWRRSGNDWRVVQMFGVTG